MNGDGCLERYEGRSGFFLVCLLLLTVGCDDRSEYDKLVEKETARGVMYNSLFLGYELGMPKEAFYDRSWDLNRQGLVMQGPQNQTVQFELDDDLSHPAKMYFYPDFHRDKVFQMRVRFIYDGWAPWNKELSSDSLLLDVVDLFREWYGEGFIEHGVTRDRFGEGVQYVKVDGNRRIVVAKYRDKEVVAVFTDLVGENAIEDEKKGLSEDG